MKRLVPLVILCCGPLAPAAFADDFYFGLNVGRSSLDAANTNASFRITETGYGGKVGYELFRWLAFEGGYTDFGKFDDTAGAVSLEAEANAITVSAVGLLPITPRFELFAKAGAARWDSRSFFFEGMETEIRDHSGTDFAYGLGLAWNFTERLALRGELEYYKFDDEDLRYGSLGLLVRF